MCASRSLHRLKRHLKLLVLHGNPCDDPPADLCVHDSVSSLTSYVYNAQTTEGTVLQPCDFAKIHRYITYSYI